MDRGGIGSRRGGVVYNRGVLYILGLYGVYGGHCGPHDWGKSWGSPSVR